MAASLVARRLALLRNLTPLSQSLLHHSSLPASKPPSLPGRSTSAIPRSPDPLFPCSFPFFSGTRLLCASPDPPEQELRHQEITGPTVERDTSPLADETRQTLHSLRKAIYDLSVAAALLGAAHLALGAWIAHSAAGAPREVAVQGVAAFAFPFAAAFLMRRTLKPLSFFSKMEDMGRLQILTLALQSSKNLRTLLLRMRVVAVSCVLGISVASLSVIWVQ